MRRHASKQNSIPNNLRQVPPNTSNHNVVTTSNSSGLSSSQLNHNNTYQQEATAGDGPSNSLTSGGGGGGGGTMMNHAKATRVKDQRDAKAKRNEWRITKMVLAIFLSFVMCYLPITITKVFDKDVRYPVFHIVAYIMLYLSSCINPIIYVIMNKQYRQAYKTVILCRPTRLLGFTQAGSSVGGK